MSREKRPDLFGILAFRAISFECLQHIHLGLRQVTTNLNLKLHSRSNKERILREQTKNEATRTDSILIHLLPVLWLYLILLWKNAK